MAAKPKVVVLISGNGSNLQALIDAAASGALPAEIALVVANRSSAFGLQRAANAGIETLVFPLKPYKDAGKGRDEYDADLGALVARRNPDLIVLAGWMHILSRAFLDALPPAPTVPILPNMSSRKVRLRPSVGVILRSGLS